MDIFRNGMLDALANAFGMSQQEYMQHKNDYARRQEENMQRWQNTKQGAPSKMHVKEPKHNTDDIVDAEYELVTQRNKGLPPPK